MKDKPYLTLGKLNKSKRIWWIKSIQTLRKWVEADMKNKNILKTVVVGEKNKKRYYILSSNVDAYIKAFSTNKTVKP